MLVIRRHPGESIRIGEDIELEVIECGHNRVKLGIRAPRHIPVVRSEVELTRDENMAAARSIEEKIPGIWGGRGGGDVVAFLKPR